MPCLLAHHLHKEDTLNVPLTPLRTKKYGIECTHPLLNDVIVGALPILLHLAQNLFGKFCYFHVRMCEVELQF